MRTIVFRPCEDFYCGIKIDGLRVSEEMQDEICDLLTDSLKDIKKSDDQSSKVNQVYASLHDLLKQRGDKSEYLEKFGISPSGWYMASCDVLTIGFQNGGMDYWQIGMIPCCVESEEYGLQLLPMHNLFWEVKNKSLEESFLSVFDGDNKKELLNQIFFQSRNLVSSYMKMSDEDLFKNISHVRSRTLGFFQKPGAKDIPAYNNRKPALTSGRFSNGEFSAIVWNPSVRDIVPFSEEKILDKLSLRFCEAKVTTLFDSNKVLLDDGQAIKINPYDGSYIVN